MAPQLFGQAGPERLQRMAGSGLPLLAMPACKDCSAPSSTEEETGGKRDGDVAGDGDAGDRGLGGVGVTGGGHL